MATLKGGGSATAGPQRFESTKGMRRSGSGFGLSGGDSSHGLPNFDRHDPQHLARARHPPCSLLFLHRQKKDRPKGSFKNTRQHNDVVITAARRTGIPPLVLAFVDHIVGHYDTIRARVYVKCHHVDRSLTWSLLSASPYRVVRCDNDGDLFFFYFPRSELN